MSIGAVDILEAVETHALESGWFESVNRHEPKNAPGNGLWAAVWVQRIGGIQSSGLSSTSGRLELRVRVGSTMFQEPQDDIDPNILVAVDDLLSRYSGDFTLGGRVRHIDLLGAYGEGLGATAGYITIDSAKYRVMDITLPLVINDLWAQAE